MVGKGPFAGVGHLMVLEEGELGTGVGCKVFKWLNVPTLMSLVLPVVLERLEVNDISSPLWDAVFLLPQQLAGVLLLVWDPAVLLIGSWKVICLAVFLWLLGGLGVLHGLFFGWLPN